MNPMKLSSRHYYFKWTKNLFLLFFLVTIFLTISRTVFALYFGEIATLTQDWAQLRLAMIMGFRFDLMPLAYITVLPFIILNMAYLIPGKMTIRFARFLIITILCFGYYLLAWIYITDYGFYSFFQDHINILFFGLFEDDTKAVITSIWKNYNVPFWLIIISAIHYAFYRFVRFLFSPYEFDLKVKRFDWRYLSYFLIGSIFLAISARGNFGRLPLSIEDAHISSNEFINKLSINGPVSLNRTIKIRRTFGRASFNYLNEFKYEHWGNAYRDISGNQSKASLIESLQAFTPKNKVLKEQPPHVVLVIMESFGSYWNDNHHAETFNLLGDLKGHFDKGIVFRNFLPAENGTIGSTVSVAVSQVIRPGARFLSESEFMKTQLQSAGHLPYKQNGYDTHFMYGGKLGWRDLGKYFRVQGYDYLWGADEIKDAMPGLLNLSGPELGNEWGIFDEYLYSFIEDRLKIATKPQFILVLTTSNHPPFEQPISYSPLPIKLIPKMLEGLTVREELAKKRFIGLQYANQKMGEFLTRINSSNLKDRTVVALTGDHSFWISKGVDSDQEFKRYSVPFFLSVPEHLRPAEVDTERFGSHEDIFPTLYHLTLSNQSYVKLGENLITEESFAMNSSGLVANKSGAYHHGAYWKWKDMKKQILEPAEETPELLKLKKHREGIISITDLYLKHEKNNN
jgi:phosphoglycerol transferase MdoB-like AlkP superfamily enzyme